MTDVRGHVTPARPAPDSFFAWVAALAAVGLAFAARVSYLDTHDSPVRHTGFDGQAVTGVSAPAQIRFDGGIRLLGHDPAVPTVEGGSALTLRLYWTADAPLAKEYSSFLHLLDAEGHRWGQSDNQHPGSYPTVRWQAGEYNRDAHTLSVLPGTPPGDYTLRAGLIVRTTGAGIDVLDERGAPSGMSVAIGTVTVTRPQRSPPVEVLDVSRRLDAALGDLTLLGVQLDRHQAAPGERLLLTLYWRAKRTPSQDHTVSVYMRDKEHRIVAEMVLPLATLSYPPSKWTAGEIVRGQHWLALPAELRSGTYTLDLRFLEPTGRPVGEPVPLGEAGQIAVIGPERHMIIPPMKHSLETNFGDRATLLGYDVEPTTARPGEALRLTLYWRAERAMARSYAVFTHLLDAESHIVAQHDGLPADWSRPTTGWLPGEVIADLHVLNLEADIPRGTYLLEVGLYDAETNIRLPVLDTAGLTLGDRVLLVPVPVE